MRHSTTNYSRVFIHETKTTAATLTKRCQEFIEICDTAQPVIELIETGTTDVSHLVAQAKGKTDVHRKDPTGDARTALHGVDY